MNKPALIRTGATILGALAGMTLCVAVAVFTTWGFNPASWNPYNRSLFALAVLYSAGVGVILVNLRWWLK